MCSVPPSAPAPADRAAHSGAEGGRAPHREEGRPQEPAGSSDQPGEMLTGLGVTSRLFWDSELLGLGNWVMMSLNGKGQR